MEPCLARAYSFCIWVSTSPTCMFIWSRCPTNFIATDLNDIGTLRFISSTIMASNSVSQSTSTSPKPDTKLDPKTTDPVIADLLVWLSENLPDVAEEDIFKQVKKLQKVFETIMTLTFEHFYNHAPITPQSEDIINAKLEELKEYLTLNGEKQLKTKKLDASTAKLDLKKEQYKLVTSIKLDDCLNLITRYSHLMAKK